MRAHVCVRACVCVYVHVCVCVHVCENNGCIALLYVAIHSVITTTSLPKSSVMEEQEKTKSERRKKAAMFVEQLRQKRAEKIAKETDIIGPLLPHEYKYCNRLYEEPPPVIDRVSR